MRTKITLLFCFLHLLNAQAQPHFQEVEVKDSTAKRVLYASLVTPSNANNIPVVVFIAGSGPTDRNGNSKSLKTNTTKLMAEALAAEGIASLRYDKVGSGKSTSSLKEENFTFDDAVADAKGWVEHVKKDGRFSKIIIAGHSEGSLVGMVSAQRIASDAFISLAGPGRAIDEIIMEQIKVNPNNTPEILTQVEDAFETLKRGDSLKIVPFYLMSLFRPSVQPYMRSWLKYNPATELAKLTIPVLILQGSTDIQVPVSDAELLFQAAPTSVYKVIPGMNHIFKNAPAERAANIATYMNAELPLHEELMPNLIAFVKALK